MYSRIRFNPLTRPALTKPHILLILTEFPPRIGGMQTHALYLSRYLADRGYTIEVFTHRNSTSQMAQEAAVFDAAQSFVIRRVLGRLSYQHNLALIAQYARDSRPDLIYSSTVFYGSLQQGLNIPVVCRCVGNDIMRPWLGYPYRLGSRFLHGARLEKLFHRWIEHDLYPDWVEALFRKKRDSLAQEAARAASLVFSNSDFTARLLTDIGLPETRIQTLVGGVDSRRFQSGAVSISALRLALGLPASSFLLMTACRLVKKKGIDFLLDVLPQLRESFPQVHLVVVGDGKYMMRYQKICAARGIENITFAGRVSHENIHRYYAACDLFVLASKESINTVTGTRDVETMGRVLCEANAAGIAVIASRSGGIPSVISDGENGLLFAVENQTEFVTKIKYLRNNPAVAQQLILNGLSRARDEFDWATILKKHEIAFDRLCNTSSALSRETKNADSLDVTGMAAYR